MIKKVIIGTLIILLVALVMSSIVFVPKNSVAVIDNTYRDNVYTRNKTFFHNIVDEKVYIYPIKIERMNYDPFIVVTMDNIPYVVEVAVTMKMADAKMAYFNSYSIESENNGTYENVVNNVIYSRIQSYVRELFEKNFSFDIVEKAKDGSTIVIRRAIETAVLSTGFRASYIEVKYQMVLP